MRGTFGHSIDELAWVQHFPVYGLGRGFVGRRWIASVGTNHLGLCHGNALVDGEESCLLVGFEGPSGDGDGRPVAGAIDMRGTLAGNLVFELNQHRFRGKSAAERDQLADLFVTKDVPALEWSEVTIAVDEQPLDFALVEIDDGNWAAYREFPGAYVYVYARNWPAGEQQLELAKIQDLTPYLEGRPDIA